MVWKCPACLEAIRHHEFEEKPRPSIQYRCHICRLELRLDRATDRLVVAPIREDENLRERSLT
jgi:hypothetical protein